jgi:hypothetical protein
VHDQRRHRLSDHPALTPAGNSRSREHSRSRLRSAAITLAVGVLILAAPIAAAGHDGGGTMGISLSAERLPPGGPLEIIGQGFLAGEVVDIRLVGGGSDVALGSVQASEAGGFAIVLRVPSDLVAGAYRVDAAVTSGIVQQADVAIDPSAPAPALTPTPANLLAPPAAGREDPLWIWAPLVVIVGAAAGFIAIARRRAKPRSLAVDAVHEPLTR